MKPLMQETMTRMCFGVIAGLLIGVAVDYLSKPVAVEKIRSKSPID